MVSGSPDHGGEIAGDLDYGFSTDKLAGAKILKPRLGTLQAIESAIRAVSLRHRGHLGTCRHHLGPRYEEVPEYPSPTGAERVVAFHANVIARSENPRGIRAV